MVLFAICYLLFIICIITIFVPFVRPFVPSAGRPFVTLLIKPFSVRMTLISEFASSDRNWLAVSAPDSNPESSGSNPENALILEVFLFSEMLFLRERH